MIYHHILDILRGRISPPGVIVSERLNRRGISRVMRDAEIFDFGDLFLEDSGQRSEIDGSTVWSVPKLTKEEDQFWIDGLIPMPAPVCWFNFNLNNNESGLLISGTAPNITVVRMDYDVVPGTGVIAGVVVRALPDDKIELDYRQALACMEKLHRDIPMEATVEASIVLLVKWFLLMINSRSTEREHQIVPPDPIRKAHNRHPLPDHTVVRIIPADVLRAMRQGSGEGRASPRLHWRRSHLREYRAPSGEVYHRIVIPRCLVGRAATDTVTHTYKVGR
jgi:hypothetical protein